MKKRILSLYLSAMIAALACTAPAMAVYASETSGEGSTAAPMQEEAAPDSPCFDSESGDGGEILTDAAGQQISPETAQAIDSADVGLTDLQKITDPESSIESAANGASDTMAELEETELEMDKSTIGAAFDSTYQFDKEDAVVYLSEAAVIKTEPSDDAEDMLTLEKYSSVRLTGSNSLQYWEVTVGGSIGYVDSALIIREASEVEALMEEDIEKEETEALSRQEQEETIVEKASEGREEWAQALKDSRREELANQTRSLSWNGPVLSRSKGSVYGPSGKETYYNLNMSGCVSNMNRRGYYYDVWVRNDGCKMFGDYIMCAANLGVHPFGSLVECSLGTCIVVDTGGFAAGNPNQLDIAVTW